METENQLILRPSPRKWIGVGLGCLAFAIGGAWMVASGEMSGWFVLVFFGLGVLVSVLCLLPNAGYLKIDREGFTVCSLFRARTTRWTDVTAFAVGRIATNKMVMFNYEASYVRSPHLRSLNKGLAGYEAGIPDNYGMTHEELAELLNRYRQASG